MHVRYKYIYIQMHNMIQVDYLQTLKVDYNNDSHTLNLLTDICDKHA